MSTLTLDKIAGMNIERLLSGDVQPPPRALKIKVAAPRELVGARYAEPFRQAAMEKIASTGANPYIVRMAYAQEMEKIAFGGMLTRGATWLGQRLGARTGARAAADALGKGVGARTVAKSVQMNAPKAATGGGRQMFEGVGGQPGIVSRVRTAFTQGKNTGVRQGTAKAIRQDRTAMRAARKELIPPTPMKAAKPPQTPQAKTPQAKTPPPGDAAADAARAQDAAKGPGFFQSQFGWGQASGAPAGASMGQRASGWWGGLSGAQKASNIAAGGVGLGGMALGANALANRNNNSTVIYR